MRMIKPIVNISKIMDAYDVIVCGFNGVIHNGNSFEMDAIEALIRLRKNGKQIVLVSNSSLRISQVIDMLYAAKISPYIFSAIVTAGEVLHQKLLASDATYKALGNAFFNLGKKADTQIFANLDYYQEANLVKADFLYIGQVPQGDISIKNYMEILSHGASLNIPMLCVGNDVSAVSGQEIRLASGGIAQQYGALGGRVLTLGKPNAQIINYALEACENVDKTRVLLIGDSILTDIKSASNTGISSVLVSKGVHVSFLGEGYIPDVTKTRELAESYDSYPDYVISNLRW